MLQMPKLSQSSTNYKYNYKHINNKYGNIPILSSLSITAYLRLGYLVINSWAVASPTIPVPTMMTSYSGTPYSEAIVLQK